MKGTVALTASISDLYASVWRNAIMKEASYWNQSGKYYMKAFNEVLPICQEDSKEAINVIKSYVATIDSLMKIINDPPDKYISVKG